jgi:hypothetical protein
MVRRQHGLAPPTTGTSIVLQHALALAQRGFHVHPCRPHSKLPATARGCKDATVDSVIIERWWQSNPDFNIAIATGEASYVFVVDVDGLDAEAELRKLEGQYGALPPTVEAITARGRHLYFEWPDRMVRNSAGKVGPGLDVRGEGGYVLAPPSVHPSGRRYESSVDSVDTPAVAPEWLLNAAADKAVNSATPPAEWRTLIKGVAEGARNSSTARLAGHLLRHHIDPLVVLDLLQCWNAERCAPPLPEKDVERIVDSIAACELRRRRAL